VIKGACAKHRVVCTLVTKSGRRFVGENWVAAPQKVCPRKKGENYDKCITVCGQAGHAETMALMLAGDMARGATAYVVGRKVCADCRQQLGDAGVAHIIECDQSPDNSPVTRLVEQIKRDPLVVA
jgi:hypothetical protein